MKIQNHEQFPGFPPEPKTWNFPNIIDGWVHKLSGAEFKVLWYLLRHTYGWQKNADKISLRQFQYGIQKKDGTWLDHGTGLCRRTIIVALKSLEDKGFMEIKRTRGGSGLKYVNWYRPKIAVQKENRL